jgi:hypothetical protein
MSFRRPVGRPTGAPDLMDLARDYEGSALPERQKAALRFADGFLAHPAGFGDAARADFERCFSREEIVEMLFKVLAHTSNKPVIALGLDAPMDPDRLTEFSYNENGEFVLYAPDGSEVVGFST